MNEDCEFFLEYKVVNQLKFDKNFVCIFCGAIGNRTDCPARKYLAINDLTANIFHYGIHTCRDRQRNKRSTDLVSDAITINPRIKPSQIQGHAILKAMPERRSWAEILKKVKSVTDKKAISNEKNKQRQKMQPLGTSFLAIKNYKEFTYLHDELYVFKVDENEQIICKTSSFKMKLAKTMNSENEEELPSEFCFFDGKVKRAKGFTTLTASCYNPFLQ